VEVEANRPDPEMVACSADSGVNASNPLYGYGMDTWTTRPNNNYASPHRD
jgi:hypothetical protein